MKNVNKRFALQLYMFRNNIRTTFRGVHVRFNSTQAYNDTLAAFKVDLKKAMLAKDAVKKDTIRGILSTIKNEEINGLEKNEFELFRVFSKMAKQRRTSLEEYIKVNRSDLAEREEQEAQIIETYLKQLPVASEEEINAKVEAWLLDILKGEVPPIGKIMSQINDELVSEWKASAKQVKAIVGKHYKTLQKK